MSDPGGGAAPIGIDADFWNRHESRGPFRFEHDLVGDERLTHQAIVALAARLPAEMVETNIAEMPDVYPSDDVPELDRDPEALVRDLVELRRWIALSHIEIDDGYRSLVDECLRPISDAIGGFERGMTAREGYLFLSPSGATTPAHLDYEHNIFLQILGSKEITVGFVDPDTEARTLESMHGGAY